MNASSKNMGETETTAQGQTPKTCKFATASAVLVAVVFCLWLIGMWVTSSWPLPKTAEFVADILCITMMLCTTVGLILGIFALVKIGRSNGQLTGKGLAILGVAVTGFVILFVSFCYLAMLHKYGRGSSLWVTLCKSNLHQLAQMMRAYANNNEGKYPIPYKWCDLLIEDTEVDREEFANLFVCVGALRGGDEGKCHYAINPNCEPNSPPDVVLLFESKGGWNQFGGPELLAPENHGGRGCNILFNDGHVDFVRTEELGKLKWRQKENIEHRTRKTE